MWPEDGKRLFDAVNRRARRAGADVWYCTNFNVLGGRADWQEQFPKIWRDSVEAGHAGMVLYESAQLTRKRGRTFHQHHPELPDLLAGLRREA